MKGFGVLVVVIGLVSGVFTIINFSTGKTLPDILAPTPTPTPTPSVSVSARPSPEVSPSKTPVPTPMSTNVASLDTDCGPQAPLSRPVPDAEICVVYWCRGLEIAKNGDVSTTNMQIKVKPRITNNSNAPLDIRIGKPSAIVLLIADTDGGARWTPPPATRVAGDKPRQVSWGGAVYWALPPNVNNDATGTDIGMWSGFATHWEGTSIPAGGSYFVPISTDKNGRVKKQGDLVFQIPLDAAGDAHPIGLALINRESGDVLAIHPFNEWGPPSDPNSF